MNLKDMLLMPLRYRIMELRGRGLYSGYPDKYRCVFIHIPKTAGTSIAHALFGMSSRHVPCIEYERANPRKFSYYFKFAFVRNPWDRLLSAYHFLKKGGMNEEDSNWAMSNLQSYESFEQFVHEWVSKENIESWVHFQPQHYFIEDSAGKISMDFLGRMENIQQDFEYIRTQLGIDVALPILNRIQRSHYSHEYTQAMRDIVAQVYEKDIAILGYSFDDFEHVAGMSWSR